MGTPKKQKNPKGELILGKEQDLHDDEEGVRLQHHVRVIELDIHCDPTAR